MNKPRPKHFRSQTAERRAFVVDLIRSDPHVKWSVIKTASIERYGTAVASGWFHQVRKQIQDGQLPAKVEAQPDLQAAIHQLLRDFPNLRRLVIFLDDEDVARIEYRVEDRRTISIKR